MDYPVVIIVKRTAAGYVADVLPDAGACSRHAAAAPPELMALVAAALTPRLIITVAGPGYCNSCGHPADWYDAKGCRFMLGRLGPDHACAICPCRHLLSVAGFHEVPESPAMPGYSEVA